MALNQRYEICSVLFTFRGGRSNWYKVITYLISEGSSWCMQPVDHVTGTTYDGLSVQEIANCLTGDIFLLMNDRKINFIIICSFDVRRFQIYCTISINSASHTSQGLWSGPDFGQCHMSLWLWLHATNFLNVSWTNFLIFYQNDGYKFSLSRVTWQVAWMSKCDRRVTGHTPRPNRSKWYSIVFSFHYSYDMCLQCLERLRTVIVETSKISSFKKRISIKYI